MTIANVIVAPGRCAIVADTAVSNGSITTKVLPMPHLRCISAAAGSLELWLNWTRMLLAGLPPETNVEDLVATAPEFLRAAWQRTGQAPTSIVLAGVLNDDAVGVWIFQSPHFWPRRFATGVWLQPPVLDDPAVVPDPPTGAGSRFDDSPEPLELTPPAPWPHDWVESVRICFDTVRRQREQRRVHSGGSLEFLELAPHMVISRRVEELEFLEAAA